MKKTKLISFLLICTVGLMGVLLYRLNMVISGISFIAFGGFMWSMTDNYLAWKEEEEKMIDEIIEDFWDDFDDHYDKS